MIRLTALATLAPAAALAHPGDHGGAGLAHAISQPDHLAALAALAIVAALALRAWRR